MYPQNCLPSRSWLAASWLGLLLSAGVDAQIVVVDQLEAPPPSVFVAYTSDSNCAGGVTFVVAEDFVLGSPVDIEAIEFVGLLSGFNLPFPVPFALRILEDSGGLPGNLVVEPTVSLSQVPHGAGNSRFLFTATFAPVPLAPGAYWVEIYETDDRTDECTSWVAGPLDPVAGRDRFARATTAPGTDWTAAPPPTNSDSNLAFRVVGQPGAVAEIPALGALGARLLTLILGAGALRQLRRSKSRC